MHEGTLTQRAIGFGLSLVLTLTSFCIILRPEMFHLDVSTAIGVILSLAIVQSAVQAIFFLHLFSEEGTRWNLVVFISTITIILIIVLFSIWIMDNLDYNMMPHVHVFVL